MMKNESKTGQSKAGSIVEFLNEKGFVKVCGGRILFYNGVRNCWRPLDKKKFQVFVRQHLTDAANFKVSSAVIEEVRKRIQYDFRFQIQEMKFRHQQFLHVVNGFVDLETGKLYPESQSMYLDYRCEFTYLEEKEIHAEAFEKFVKTSLQGDETKRRLLLQILGYCLSDDAKAKVAFFLIGAGDSGKSVILEFLMKVLAEDEISTVPFNRIGDRFNRALLASSRVNICSELTSGKLGNIDFFKAVTSQEVIFAEEKGSDPFQFRVRTKLLSAGNVMPQIPEAVGAEALLRRMVILYFPESVKKEEQDRNLLSKLIKEKDQICTLAVRELITLQKNNFVFEQPDDAKNYEEQLHLNFSALKEFVKECCEIMEGKRVHLCQLWDAFRDFCEDNLYDPQIKKLQFRQEIALIPGVSVSKFRLNTKNPQSGFEGIGLKSKRE